MSVLRICEVLEGEGLVGSQLRQELASSFAPQIMQRRFVPTLLLGSQTVECTQIAGYLHRVASQMSGLEGEYSEQEASYLHKRFQRKNGKLTLPKGTLHLLHLERCSSKEQSELFGWLGSSPQLSSQELLLFGSFEIAPALDTDWLRLQTFFTQQIQLPPLYKRSADIDPLIYGLFQTQLQESNLQEKIEGLSLEAVAHIHRAILQTRRNAKDLEFFFVELCQRTLKEQLPLHENHIVAWPTVRILEDLWGYQLQGSPALEQEELNHYDFQDRLFSASLEHSAQRSGFSRELLELQCSLLKLLVDELPPHQRSYQGMTARLDQLTWVGMKLISNARTQAEMREFFGFGGTGKIPKATAKLKFDQHQLEQYGFRPTDPVPWPDTSPPEPSPPTQSPPPQNEQPARRVYEVEGELAETLFWRHQDLFTVLAADPLPLTHIAKLMNVAPNKVKKDLSQLVEHRLLLLENGLYQLPADDFYYHHAHNKLRFFEGNVVHRLGAAFQNEHDAILDNVFLRLPPTGLAQLRKELIDPFVFEQFLPLSDQQHPNQHYEKEMYALLLIGTHRLSPHTHGRTPLQERVIHYFREACLQRVDRKQRHQAICMQVTVMMNPEQASMASTHVQQLRKELKQYLPQGRGNKPNFNQTLCFTRVPLSFYRDLPDTSMMGLNAECQGGHESL